jgi:hypothetical protein
MSASLCVNCRSGQHSLTGTRVAVREFDNNPIALVTGTLFVIGSALALRRDPGFLRREVRRALESDRLRAHDYRSEEQLQVPMERLDGLSEGAFAPYSGHRLSALRSCRRRRMEPRSECNTRTGVCDGGASVDSRRHSPTRRARLIARGILVKRLDAGCPARGKEFEHVSGERCRSRVCSASQVRSASCTSTHYSSSLPQAGSEIGACLQTVYSRDAQKSAAPGVTMWCGSPRSPRSHCTFEGSTTGEQPWPLTLNLSPGRLRQLSHQEQPTIWWVLECRFRWEERFRSLPGSDR